MTDADDGRPPVDDVDGQDRDDPPAGDRQAARPIPHPMGHDRKKHIYGATHTHTDTRTGHKNKKCDQDPSGAAKVLGETALLEFRIQKKGSENQYKELKTSILPKKSEPP